MEKPDRLDTRGSYLWDKVVAEFTFDAAGYALLEDICREADIVARLEKSLRSTRKEWMKLVEDNDFQGSGTKLIITVDHVLTEVRQHRLAIKQMMNQLGIASVLKPLKKSETKDESKEFWEAMEENAQS